MRKILLLSPALLVACATAPAEPPAHGVTPGRVCQPGNSAQFLGQTATSETGAAILQATGAGSLRWGPPGVMMTMDFREDRVTVRLDASNRITAINCG